MSNELLEVTINGDLSVADNVEAVCAATMERAKAALKDAGIEIVEVDGVKVAKGVTDSKDHKTLCTNVNKTAKFLSDQRIDFEKRLYEVPAVKRIVGVMKKTPTKCLPCANRFGASTIRSSMRASRRKNTSMLLSTSRTSRCQILRR